MDSAGPVAIVTGASGVTTFDVSDYLLQSSYRVCLVDNEAEGKEAESKLKKKHGSEKVIFVQCNITSKYQFNDAFEKTLKAFGRIDLLINNAEIVDEHDPGTAVAINLMGSIYGCELGLKYMSKKNGGNGGTVINISSTVGLIPYPDTPVYVATKHAVVGLTRSYGHQVHFEGNEVTFAAICRHSTGMDFLREPRRLNVDSPVDIELLSMEEISDGITKILKDKRNGSVLVVLPGGMYEYAELPGSLMSLPIPLI